MYRDTPCDVDFFEWLETLSDEEHSAVLEALRFAAKELGCRVNRHPLVTQYLLNFLPHHPSELSLN